MGWFDKVRSLVSSNRVNVNDRFEMLREAVSGTMSQFFKARDRTHDRIVGLKLSDTEKTAHFESRFKGLDKPPEGVIAETFDSPYIVKTHEHGLTTDGQRYLVMEFLDGPGVHMLINNREEKLPETRLTMLRQMAEALKTVHEAGYIHRDICPRNFIASADLSSVKLIDFGLTVPDKPEFRQPGNRTGTPVYMAPEVVRRRPTDLRVDIFSFGITAYQMLALALPWPGSETTGMAALAHDTSKPEELKRLRPDIDRKLATAVMRCIQPKADARPRSMDEFLSLIRPVKKETR